MTCPCGSGLNFENCCEPFLKGEKMPPTAEALMRSRYTAYTQKDINYIKKTLAPESMKNFDMNASKKWADEATWHGLKILKTEKGGANDRDGVVEFIATFTSENQKQDHHEVSTFRRSTKGDWLFVDGEAHTHKAGEGHNHTAVKRTTVVNEAPKIGRNDPCPCDSGQKYKKCCGKN